MRHVIAIASAAVMVTAVVVAFALPATAQDAPSTPAADTAATDVADQQADMIQLTFPENMDVKVLIDYVSQRLGMNVRYDESKVKRKVTIER